MSRYLLIFLSDYWRPSLITTFTKVLLSDDCGWRVNRMRESLCLFSSVVNSRWFLRTTFILFLNKFDIFKAKLSRIPLERFYPEYNGGSDVYKAAKFILWKFQQGNVARRSIYP
jgi:guanine nucleotide-binding protein subunit alpha